jgi:hypothetical protein
MIMHALGAKTVKSQLKQDNGRLAQIAYISTSVSLILQGLVARVQVLWLRQSLELTAEADRPHGGNTRFPIANRC